LKTQFQKKIKYLKFQKQTQGRFMIFLNNYKNWSIK
jgi:hypothetical protein